MVGKPPAVVDGPALTLKPKEDGRLLGGHAWIFSNELATKPASAEPGQVTDLYATSGAFLGRGFYNPHSLIAFRLLTDQKDQSIDLPFLEKRLRTALEYRESAYPGCSAYRWVFGESDRVPGFLLDRYGDVVVAQAISAGMEKLKPLLIEAITRVVPPRAIVWRSDSTLRELEGLPERPAEVVQGALSGRVTIELENGRFEVDPLHGQKTGFYFDQRDNRQAIAAWCKGKRVLDAFCYSGAFGIAAAKAGAREVVLVDSAHAALELAEINLEHNQVKDRCTLVQGDALALLAKEIPGGPFDVISIDPPAYARSKKHLPAALKAYEKLNALALSSLKRGGILATSSCSHHVTRDAFLEVLRRAARKSHRHLRLIEYRSQAKDHPVLLSMPETEYLKCAILQVL